MAPSIIKGFAAPAIENLNAPDFLNLACAGKNPSFQQ
jgi:hypothetical protein